MLQKILNFLKVLFLRRRNSEDIKDKKHTNEDPIWKVMNLIVILGFAMIICISINNFKFSTDEIAIYLITTFIFSLGLLVVIAGASFMSGGLIGFLFGIPRILQNNSENNKDILIKETVIIQNDNLVQVSDWLTKIIVGVGLTQLHNIPFALKSLGDFIQVSASSNVSITVNTSISVIIYFTITGFAFSYLWTRIYFTPLIANTTNNIEALLAKKEKEVELKNKELNTMASSFIETTKDIRQEALLDSKYNNDPQKGKWGGTNKSNERILSAFVSETSFNNQFFNVTLLVKTTNPNNPLRGYVTFHLHDTFIRPIRKVKVVNEKAQIDIIAFGAFTVGVVCDDGETKLELDLATDIPNIPELFKER